MNANPSRWMLPVLLTGALALTGCGHAPNAPVSAPSSLGSEVSSYGLYEAPVEEGQDPAPVPEPVPGGSATVSVIVKGKSGGTLQAGRFTLQIPKGAFNGNATITMTQADLSRLEVQIQVYPVSKASLKVAATLTADASALPMSELSQSGMWSWNAASNSFAPVAGSTVDLGAHLVRAPLGKLSKSKVEKL